MLAKLNDNGKIEIDVGELLDGLTTEQKRELATALAVQDDIIAEVAAQIMEGWTSDGSHAARDEDKADPHYPLGKAIRAVALRSGDVAKRQIESLCRSMRHAEAYHATIYEWAWKMYHAMNDANMRPPEKADISTVDDGEYAVVLKSTLAGVGMERL